MRRISFEELKEFVLKSRKKRTMITFHSIGDTDSVASAVALSALFTSSAIVTPDFITANSRSTMEELGFDGSLISKGLDKTAELVVMVDVNNFEDCAALGREIEESAKEVLIIDHHSPHELQSSRVLAFNSEAHNSASSIVFDLLDAVGSRPDERTSRLLLAGILADSAEFRNASNNTFVQIGRLLDLGATSYQRMLSIMQRPASAAARAEKISRMFKADVRVIGGLLFVTGMADTHANLLADDAIRIGADVSLFEASNGKEVTFSARLRPTLERELGLHLGTVMKQLAPVINGSGGGHPNAAGAYGPGMNGAARFREQFISRILDKTAGRRAAG